MGGPVAIGQRPAAEQLAHTLGPPALHPIAGCQQIVVGGSATDEHHRLPQQHPVEDIPLALKPPPGKSWVAEEGQGLQYAAHGAGAGQRPWLDRRRSKGGSGSGAIHPPTLRIAWAGYARLAASHGCWFNGARSARWRGAHLGRFGVLVVGAAVTAGAGHPTPIVTALQPQYPVIVRGGEALDRAGVDAEQGRGGHQVALGDVELVRCPALDLGGARAVDQIHLDQLAVGVEAGVLQAAGGGRGGHEAVGIGGGDRALGQQHHQVGAVGDLALVPGVGAQLLA